jgi:hypothetical protein
MLILLVLELRAVKVYFYVTNPRPSWEGSNLELFAHASALQAPLSDIAVDLSLLSWRDVELQRKIVQR